jgi:chromosome partitioning protein
VPHRSGTEHCQVLAVVNFKGGSGKTTTAAHLAQYLALRGYRVLAVDLDPQASLTALHGYQPEFDVGPNQTLYAAIRHDDEQKPLSEVVRKTYFPGLDLVPGNLELMEFEHDTPRVLADRNAEPFFGRIATALGSVADDYDVMILDCPPQLGFLTLGALCAATAMLVTVHPQMLDVMSMCQFLLMASDLLGVVQEAGADLDYDFLRYVVTRYEPSDAPQTQMVGFMRSLFRERVLTHLMLKSTAVSDAGLSKQTLYEIGRESFTRATYDRAIEALDGVNGEIEALMHRAWGRVPS